MRDKTSIIGAATAGLVAAKRLAALGIDTTVYDQKVALGTPVRASGILSINGLSTLGIDYAKAATNTLRGANIHSGGRTMSIASQRPIAYVLDRQMLNNICRGEAEDSGAKVVTGKRIYGADLDHMRGCGVIMGADGAVSTVAKHFGMGRIERMLLTYKAEFNVDVPDPVVVDLFFDNAKYNGLFAWLCPNERDILEVGVGIDSGAGNAKAAFERFTAQPQIKEIIGERRPVGEGACVIPMSLRKRFVDEKNNVMLVGDAAGQVKPTTGGGIIFGGNASIIAAQTIGKYFEGTGRLSDYEMRFRKAYGFDLVLHSMINRFYNSLSPRSIGLVIDCLNAFGIDRFLSIYGDMDRPSLVIKRFFLRSFA